MAELLFVIGGYKSGTTTTLAMLNCHKDIYLEGELLGHQKSFKRFSKNFPEVISSCNTSNRPGFYADYAKYLESNGKKLKYIGEKIATLAEKDLFEVSGHKVIFVCRDLKTWLAKPSLPRIPACKKKVWPGQFAVESTKLLINSFMLKNAIRIRMEDVLSNNEEVLRKIGSFINIPLENDLANWNTKIAKYEEGDPKGEMEWWSKQPSSLLGPTNKRDVSVTVNNVSSPWKDIYPVFKKYYDNIDGDFSDAEIKKDLLYLGSVKSKPLKSSAVYKKIDIEKITK